jgi:hypothetical protein
MKLSATQEKEHKAQRDREYRDKRLMVAAQLAALRLQASANTALVWADELIKANESMAVPE